MNNYTFEDWVKEFRVSSGYVKPTNYYAQNEWNMLYKLSMFQRIFKTIIKYI